MKSHNPGYKLFLKHWEPDMMPSKNHQDIVFISDSLDFPSLDSMLDEFAGWGKHFSDSEVGFQFGYDIDVDGDGLTDRRWWSLLADPPREIATAIVNKIPNAQGVYWADFTVSGVFPRR